MSFYKQIKEKTPYKTAAVLLVGLFNGISTLFRLFNAKAIKNSCDTI